MAKNPSTATKSASKAAAPASTKTEKVDPRLAKYGKVYEAFGGSVGKCLSGSGRATKKLFAPGGDATLKSALLREYRAATNQADKARVKARADLLGWGHLMVDKPVKVKADKPDKPAADKSKGKTAKAAAAA